MPMPFKQDIPADVAEQPALIDPPAPTASAEDAIEPVMAATPTTNIPSIIPDTGAEQRRTQMRLYSRMMTDLTVLTEGKRLPTDAEIDDALNRAARALGLRMPDRRDAVQRHDRSEVPPTELAPRELDKLDDGSFGNETPRWGPGDPTFAMTSRNFSGRDYSGLSADVVLPGNDVGEGAFSTGRLSNAAYVRFPTEDDRFKITPVNDADRTPSGYRQNDYRTTPEARAWLDEVRPQDGKEIPYPKGDGKSWGKSSKALAEIRRLTGYYYTLPEVKAFLDLLSTTETGDRGYLTSHDPKPMLDSLERFPDHGLPSGRYQIQKRLWKDIGKGWFSRDDFSPITQDVIAIAALMNRKVIDALLNNDLDQAFMLASSLFASIPKSAEEDHSAYTRRPSASKGKSASRAAPSLQPTPIPFNDLRAEYYRRLDARRKEFAEAKSAWEKERVPPKAFISPFRWRSFGIEGF